MTFGDGGGGGKSEALMTRQWVFKSGFKHIFNSIIEDAKSQKLKFFAKFQHSCKPLDDKFVAFLQICSKF